ncbi:MAG: hypothetical protein ACOVQE_06100 [Chitinophagaceae bacterium]
MCFSRLTFILLTFIIVGISCKNEAINYIPNEQLTEVQQQELINYVIRYIGKLPAKANHQNKFDSSFNNYYQQLAKEHYLLYLHKKDSVIYFAYYRQAPSLQLKYVTIAGTVAINNNGAFNNIKEAFRTWKMPLDELKKVSAKLFDEWVNGKDLSKYYPENSGDEYIIEFPSEKVIYNDSLHVWERQP